jgi:hypothetical protein
MDEWSDLCSDSVVLDRQIRRELKISRNEGIISTYTKAAANAA